MSDKKEINDLYSLTYEYRSPHPIQVFDEEVYGVRFRCTYTVVGGFFTLVVIEAVSKSENRIYLHQTFEDYYDMMRYLRNIEKITLEVVKSYIVDGVKLFSYSDYKDECKKRKLGYAEQV